MNLSEKHRNVNCISYAFHTPGSGNKEVHIGKMYLEKALRTFDRVDSIQQANALAIATEDGTFYHMAKVLKNGRIRHRPDYGERVVTESFKRGVGEMVKTPGFGVIYLSRKTSKKAS
jgi:hypothetical protein